MKFHAIRENHLYAKAYSKGKRAVLPSLAVYVLPDYTAEARRRAHPRKEKTNRIGLTATKKLGGAVVRNRVKRIMREAYRAVDKEHTVKTGFLIVIAARERATDMTSTLLAQDLKEALSRLHLLVQ